LKDRVTTEGRFICTLPDGRGDDEIGCGLFHPRDGKDSVKSRFLDPPPT